VNGDVQAREVVLEGSVRGNLSARERVRIATTGKLEGDVAAERLVVEEGAHVAGRVDAGAGEARAHATSRPATGAGAPVSASPNPRPNVS
jgi:cytoskeletal protein CcmA (bactofilin family)